ncbi:MAG: DNA-protecting protein DprA [Tissierellia bacterium]|nr:DNA-protecting protein DprA [Tissierellia bacterium]
MEYWLWLRGIRGLGPIIEKRLLNHFKTPKSIYEAEEDELMSIMGIGKVIANSIVSSHSLNNAYSVLNKMEKKNIKLLTYNDSLYPCIAKDYVEAPTLLYYRGMIKENIEGVAIVGSRRCSNYGKRVAIEAAEFLAECNIPVISGIAKGIDGYAHTACLNRNGYTIAFLGNGVDICYPSEHISLMEAIIENGAVISEYPPGTTTHSEFFPRRNALISSWCKKILIAEAAERSGALITSDFARELNREVFAAPYEIHSSSGKGTNRLILEGATIYLDPSQLMLGEKIVNIEDVIEGEDLIESRRVKIHPNNNVTINKELSVIEEKILSCIMEKPKTIEEIGIELNIDGVDLIEEISIMELEGSIRDIAGGRYIGCRG